MKAFDVIIIGFGKGGKTLAAEFAKRGQKVAVIERSDKMYGVRVSILAVFRLKHWCIRRKSLPVWWESLLKKKVSFTVMLLL